VGKRAIRALASHGWPSQTIDPNLRIAGVHLAVADLPRSVDFY
jgi:hypothetical protein